MGHYFSTRLALILSKLNRDPTKWIIAFGFSSLLALMTSITFISLTQMDKNIASMANLVDITNAKILAAQNMRENTRLSGEALLNTFLAKSPGEKKIHRSNLGVYGIEFNTAQDFLLSHSLITGETMMFHDLEPLIKRSEEVTNITIEKIIALAPITEQMDLLQQSNQSRRQVLDILDKLIVYQDKQASHLLEDNILYHNNTRRVIILLATASFLFGILISIIVIRQTSKKNFEIQYQATHDALTQLVNRKEFERRLQYAIHSAKQRNLEHALCFLDLDQFKIINDTCGHDAGDQLLINLSRLIESKIRDRDTLGRLGGDEFGVLLEHCPLDKAIEVAEGIVTLISNYEFDWKGRSFRVGVSIGMVHITNKSVDSVSAMSEADVACYAAKDMGRGRVYIHELHDEHVNKIHKELSWVADIDDSLKDGRFLLYAQPIVPVTNTTSESRPIYEVLLRLRDDEEIIISPGEYIPAAERFNLMRAVDNWVISEVLKKIAIMHRDGVKNIPLIFINLSANSLVDKSFCSHVINTLERFNIPDNSICFEITETAAIKNIQLARELMLMLKKSRCLFALDDFGSGMSSFTYLKNLPVDYLKIDGSIVNNIDNSTADQAMVAAIHQIGHVMKINTIAEHVENEQILSTLKDMGVDYAQGYHVGKPQPIHTIIPH